MTAKHVILVFVAIFALALAIDIFSNTDV